MLAPSSSPVVGLGIPALARVLVVESRPGSLATAVAGLEGQGLSCTRVRSHRDALERLQFDSRFCLCVSDLVEDDEGRRSLYFKFPEMSWVIQAPRDSVPPLRAQDRRVRGSQEELLDVALKTLRAHPYDARILDVMDQALGRTWVPFGALKGAHFVRRDARILDGIAAVVEVAGRDVWGRVVFSASEKVLFRHVRRTLGTDPTSVDEVADAAGECANRLAGAVRRHYRAHGLTSSQTAPFIVTGPGTRVTPISGASALVVEHRSERGARVFFEWQLGNRPRTDGRVAYGQLPTGEVVFM